MRAGKILVVDDDTPSRLLLRMALQRRGHEVVAVGTAAEACAAIETAERGFEAVVTDWRLPQMDGAALADWLHERCAKIGLVIVSAEDGEDLARLARHPAVVGTLGKPIDFARLHDLVRQALARADFSPTPPRGE